MKDQKIKIFATMAKFSFLFIFLTSLTISTYGQDHSIYHVKFDYYHSMRIPNHHVSVEFQRFGDSISVHVVSEPMHGQDSKWDETKIDSNYKLNKSEFDKIAEAVKQVNCSDIASGIDFTGLDGSTFKLSFGGISSEISYKVWTPNYDTEKRNLSEFMNACKLILRIVNFDPEEII
jgi:hypothetical protein